MYSLFQCRKGTSQYGAAIIPLSSGAVWNRQWKMAECRGYLSPWYRVCTKAIFISKGSYGNVEPKNVILVLVQKGYFPLRGRKLSGFMHRCIEQSIFTEILGYLSPWYRVCTKAISISKGSYGNVEPKNVVLVLVQKGYFPIRNRKLPGLMHRCIGPTIEIFGNSGLPFAKVPCLH